MKESDLFFGGAGKIDERGVEGFDASSGEIFEKAAEGDKVIGLSEGRKAFVAYVIGVTIEFEAIFA